jgi:uncharacterized protein (TIGR03382 family)
LLVVSGLCVAANGQANVTMQVSPVGGPENWGSSITASPGQSVDVRVTVAYNGTASPLGLASMYFQPTISNWRNTGSVDVMSPLVNGGQGSNTSTPIGAVPDAMGQFGRIIPFASRATNGVQTLTGMVQSVSGITYLRVAQQYGTDWVGQGLNFNGDRGVPITQLDDVGRTDADPTFNMNLGMNPQAPLVVFKFRITLSSDNVGRTMIVDAPALGFGNLNTTTGVREVRWYAGMNENTGSIRGAATVTTATITAIPTPASLGLLGLGGLAVGRRRR